MDIVIVEHTVAHVPSLRTELTLADLHEHFGPLPAGRLRTLPAPGTATEADVIYLAEREDRLCELVDGVLVEKSRGIASRIWQVKWSGC